MAYDNDELTNRIEECLLGGLLDHYRCRLARKNGRRHLASRWWLASHSERDLAVALLHSARGIPSRRRVYERCTRHVKNQDEKLRAVASQVVAGALGVPVLEPALDREDTAAFWERVQELVDACLGSQGVRPR